MMEPLSGLPHTFGNELITYHAQIRDAIRRNAHHDHRRALLMEFLRKAFGIEIDEIELELKVKVAEARGRIDAFYKFVIFEMKVNLDRERGDAIRELKKYFESLGSPSDYIAVVTDGLVFEVYDYDAAPKEPRPVRSFQLDPVNPDIAYLNLDELLAAGRKIPPTSDDIVGRFGLNTTTFVRAIKGLQVAFTSVEHDSAVGVKFREWNALLSKVYGSAIGDKDLFLRHTYLTLLSRAIVTLALFPQHVRGSSFYRDLLTGTFFRDQSITNLAEPDFFSWALDNVAETPFADIFDAIFRRLEEFDWSKLDEDLLKMLYQELIDPADRSGLGEYYTPDWLAEMILQDICYDGGSLLDPSCGSGTFLFCAIRRMRSLGLTGEKLIKFAMNSVIGLDVHPVAVLMSKANILLALAQELRQKRDFDVQLRVYMADTLQTEEKTTKNYLGVPVGESREFLIPLQSLELDRNLDSPIDQMMIFASRGTTPQTLEAARKGFKAKIKDLTLEEQNYWGVINFELMVQLIRSKQDSVWAFILKNAFRPGYIRKSKVDVIVGNPPWLSYRDIAEPMYKDRIRSLVLAYDLLDQSDSQLVTRLDTSTLFYIHCQRQFLKEGGTIAFVMPKTVILPSKQHLNFQRDGFTKLHDLGKITVLGLKNQHFFNVKSCVAISSGRNFKTHVPKVVWSGQLPKKNMLWGQCRSLLRRVEEEHELLTDGDVRSPYYFPKSLQGATLVPRTLWSVDIDKSVPLNTKIPRLKTSEYAYGATKEKKWRVRLKGAVEREFLFCTVLGEDLLPFFIRHLTMYILPVTINGTQFYMATQETILGLGFENASEWVKQAETIFHKRSKDSKMTALAYLDYQSKIVKQGPYEPFIVLYNRSGTNISCAYLSSEERKVADLEMTDFVADAVTHYIYCGSETEAHYLVGILNSNIVNDAIKPYQTEGVYHGKRDIYRRPFEVCPIEEFDPTNPTHREISAIAKAAKDKVARWGLQLEGTLAKVRERSRDLIRQEMSEIDSLVLKMFRPVVKTESKTKNSNQVSMF